jgi:hypothetical protein
VLKGGVKKSGSIQMTLQTYQLLNGNGLPEWLDPEDEDEDEEDLPELDWPDDDWPDEEDEL